MQLLQNVLSFLQLVILLGFRVWCHPAVAHSGVVSVQLRILHDVRLFHQAFHPCVGNSGGQGHATRTPQCAQ